MAWRFSGGGPILALNCVSVVDLLLVVVAVSAESLVRLLVMFMSSSRSPVVLEGVEVAGAGAVMEGSVGVISCTSV